MTALLLDTSTLIKWFHAEGEGELAAARRLREAHVQGDVDAHVLDLAVYEVGNVLTTSLRWQPADVADQLDDLLALVGAPLTCQPEWLRRAAALAGQHRLTCYDAAWAAAAEGIGIPLVSADQSLLSADLAEPATALVGRLAL